MATPSTKWNPRDYPLEQEIKRLRATAERYKELKEKAEKETKAAKNQVRQYYIYPYMYRK